MIQEIRIDQYDYPLPDERIAKHPLAERDQCKLLVRRNDGSVADHLFADIPSLLPAGAMLVYNNTRVINARLRFRKGADGSGALIEIFCLEPHRPVDYAVNFATTDSCEWLCFVGNSKRWKSGTLSQRLTFGNTEVILSAERVEQIDASSIVRFSWHTADGSDSPTFSQIIEAAGEIPIPPYLNRNTEQTDTTDYQTIFSHVEGSVAAPTAGLHFTDRVLSDIDNRGIARRELTLHVGAGTFQPVKNDTIGEHHMHSEFIAVDRALIEEIAATDRPVFAVGTTSVRTLETLYQMGRMAAVDGSIPDELPQWAPYNPELPHLLRAEAFTTLARVLHQNGCDRLVASTRLMIAPGYRYGVVDGIITNFHQPRSTLLLLVSAFIGDDWRAIYDHALDSGYRFLSYGDACLFLH